LGHVIGGGLLFLSAYLVDHNQPGKFGRLLLGVAPFGWIYCKEWLREHYYQFCGKVEQRKKVWENPLQVLLTGITASISLAASGFAIYILLKNFSWELLLGSLVYVAVLLAIPFIVWRYLRAPYEFIVGVALFLFSAILLGGTLLPGARDVFVWGFLFVRYFMALAEIVALVMIPVGLVQHLEFLKLRRKMRRVSKEAA
jgi:hypothetical protein